ncbi:MAG: hypothetical protein LBQ91_01455 [Oscillospiraceae bacterium]|jgi:hypothetical protein|nr:hypothetical protein [Oscillospiraceae bacterium]
MKNFKRILAFCITVIMLFSVLLTSALAADTMQLKPTNPLTPSDSNRYGGGVLHTHPLNSAKTFDLGFYAEGKISGTVAGGTSVIVKGMIRAYYDSNLWRVHNGNSRVIKIWSTINNNTNGSVVTVETARGSYCVVAWNLNTNSAYATYGSTNLTTTYWSKYF